MITEAFLSDDRQYRYWLRRIWDPEKPLGCSIGINPSTADETADDPTIRKDIGFFKRLGLGGLLKLNVGSFRSTNPVAWRHAPDRTGPLGTPEHLRQYVEHFQPVLVVAAWGKNGNYASLACAAIQDALHPLMCFGTNPDGTPRHTLMLPYTTALRAFHEHYEGQNECTTCDRWAGKVGVQ